ncbi:MAG TPA: type IV toxin-antitoxin system AbiEi family antitoxin domain-containing protein [Ktedonobacteraceae bacterium]|nr:type IV toxin-antitoxin system AbiEi family antitoxin domain-containing protein [Ktedonobacteraceae bacterium]
MSLSPYSRRSDEVLALVRQLGVLRSRDLAAHGIAREHLSRLVRGGHLRRIERGLYVLPDANQGEHRQFAEMARRVPGGVVCLLSALAFHHLTTQAPDEVWLALERDAHCPQITQWPLRIVRFSGLARSFGIEEHQVGGVPIQVYSPAKTAADCFKFRSKLGQGIALDALRETWRARKATISELWEAAQVCRVAGVMRPYLELLGA